MRGKELTLDDRKALQLEMMNEIDRFCRDNNIKYALSCGTLIGAVRHGGYIPWDDDVDITMLYSDVIRFRELFKSENLKYCDVETERYYGYPFSRIVSTKTYSKFGAHKCNGVFIDLYPIIECSNNTDSIERLLPKGVKLYKRMSWYLKWYSRLLRYTPLTIMPGFEKAIKECYLFMINEVQLIGGGYFYQMGGPLKGNDNDFYHNLWPFNPLENLVDIKFEDSLFCIPARYDEFLSVRYGDYMTLPPEHLRVPHHGGLFYWR